MWRQFAFHYMVKLNHENRGNIDTFCSGQISGKQMYQKFGLISKSLNFFRKQLQVYNRSIRTSHPMWIRKNMQQAPWIIVIQKILTKKNKSMILDHFISKTLKISTKAINVINILIVCVLNKLNPTSVKL